MLRDTLRTEEYFASYLCMQDKRIAQFSQKLDELNAQANAPSKILQCHHFLSGLLHDKIYAQYSYGSSFSIIRETVVHYLFHIQKEGRLSYQEAMDAISLSIVFHIPFPQIPRDCLPEDALLFALLEHTQKAAFAFSDVALMFPESSSAFLKALQGTLSSTSLRQYIEKNWYSDNKDASWHDSHKSNRDIYCGYWCFVGAAVAILLQWDLHTFEGCPYFPIDVIP